MKFYKFWIGAIILVAFLVTGAAAMAADFVGPKGTDTKVVIPSTEEHKNLYLMGEEVVVDSGVTGDLFVAGGKVTINGIVAQDLVVLGGEVIINGQVGGDVRAAGGDLKINAPVTGDVLLAGGTVSFSENSSVAGDVIVATGEMSLSAPVLGEVKVVGGTLFFDSVLSKNLSVRGADKVRFGEHSKVLGSTKLKVKEEPAIHTSASFASSPEVVKISKNSNWMKYVALQGLWVKLLASILAALLLIWIFPRLSKKMLAFSKEKSAQNIGIALLVLIALPIICLVSLVSMIGVWFGMAVIGLWMVWCVLSFTVASLFIGSWVMQRLTSKKGEAALQEEVHLDWQAAVLGGSLLVFVGMIPVVGWVAIFALTLMTGGGILRLFWQAR